MEVSLYISFEPRNIGFTKDYMLKERKVSNFVTIIFFRARSSEIRLSDYNGCIWWKRNQVGLGDNMKDVTKWESYDSKDNNFAWEL